MKKTAKILNIIMALCLAGLPFARLNFGVDFTDTGYSVTNFINFTDKRATWSVSTYLSNLCGHIFMQLPFGKTFIGIRAYCTFVVSGLLVFLFLKLNKRYNFVAVFLGLLISLFLTWCPFTVLYNYLSYFLIAVVVFLLLEGIDEDKKLKLVLAGVVLGLAVFARISNFTYALLIVPAIVFGILLHKEAKVVLKETLCCVGGFAGGFLLMFVLSGLTHGFSAYSDMISSLTALSGAEYGYSFSDMLLTLPKAVIHYGKWLFLLACCLAVSLFSSKKFKDEEKAKLISWALAGSVLMCFLIILRYMSYWSVFTIHDYNGFLSVEIFVVVSVLASLVISIVSSASNKFDARQKFISLCVICFIIVTPLGTNTGMASYENNLFLILPASLGSLYVLLTGEDKKIRFLPLRALSYVLLAALLFQSTRFYMDYCYGSAGNGELTASFEKGVLKGTRALPGMVDIIEGLEDNVRSCNLSGREVITWGDIPLMGFVLDMPTAFSTGWPDLTSFSEDTFVKELSTMDKPVIIVNRWFSGGDPLNPEVWQYSKKAEILSDFMYEKNYRLTFENDKFRVYLAD